ncbi:MAG: ferrochelatase [Alphaproteobacteria bacterium]|nr:ferrochelatase [Alphaproteobacteria bacterium]
MSRTAVVLFNLGGPDGPDAVEPFLFNLFNDPAIIGAPKPIRRWLARRISRKRAPLARDIYAELGGGSPLLPNSRAQARALEDKLGAETECRVFVAMRYWHPMSDEVAADVLAYGPDRIVLLPLYPHYSTTTGGSSLAAWRRAAAGTGLDVESRVVCCYPTEPGFIAALAELTQRGIDAAREQAPDRPLRVLFSAHGLPEKVIRKGDPYADHVERTAAAVADRLALDDPAQAAPGLSWTVCYQSRVGPLKWIEPYTDAEIVRAAADGAAAIVVPLAFVSEHSETLVELDIEYAKLAADNAIPAYVRVPTVSTHPAFVGGLASLVRRALDADREVTSERGGRLCPADRSCCAQGGVA